MFKLMSKCSRATMAYSWLCWKCFTMVVAQEYGCFNLRLLNSNLFAKDSIEKNLYTEAVAWRSLSHRFILPLLGIYEDGSQLLLVSPFMANGALREWRRDHVPVRIDEIRRLVRCRRLSEPSNKSLTFVSCWRWPRVFNTFTRKELFMVTCTAWVFDTTYSQLAQHLLSRGMY